MDVIRNFFGNLSSGIIRLAVTVGILAAVYFFAIRPVLDTTEKISDQATQSIQTSFGDNSEFQRSIQESIRQTNQQIQHQVQRGLQPPPTQTQITRTISGLTPAQARRLNRCIRRARGELPRINACFDRFSRR